LYTKKNFCFLLSVSFFEAELHPEILIVFYFSPILRFVVFSLFDIRLRRRRRRRRRHYLHRRRYFYRRRWD
jgi:hypothetical protein